MSHKLGTKLTGFTLAAILAGAFFLPAAQATPISFYDDASAPTPSGVRFTVGCNDANGDCSGLLAAVSGTNPLAWSSTNGQALKGPSNAKPASEMNFVNGLLATNFTASSGHIEPTNKNKNPFEFHTNAAYFLIKVGGGPTHQAYALLKNLDTNLDLWFTATGQAGALSHYITFGKATTSVPEPAALGMFGFGLLLIGGFLALRRRYA